MHSKYLLTFILSFYFISCDTTPKNEMDAFENEQEKKELAPETDYEINEKASIVAMADIIKPEDEEFSGKAYFTQKENELTLTVILNNADTDVIFPVYLIKTDCNNENLYKKPLKEDSTAKTIGSIKILKNGTGRSEFILEDFSETQEDKILNYNIVIAQTDGGVIGCGEIKKYIEEKNLSNAAN